MEDTEVERTEAVPETMDWEFRANARGESLRRDRRRRREQLDKGSRLITTRS